MQEPQIKTNIYDPHLWKRFLKITGLYWFSEEKRQAWGILTLLILMMVLFPLLLAKTAIFGKDVTDALEKMNQQAFNQALFMMFFAISAIIILDTLKNYVHKALDINWRLWLTSTIIGTYFKNRAYYHVNGDSDVDNPDQRISEGVKNYTDISLDYTTTIIQSLCSFAVFSVMLLRLSPKLLCMVLLYVGVSGIITMLLSRRLINLNFLVQQRGADFRHDMVHVRDNTESIAFFQGETREKEHLLKRLGDYIGSKLTLIRWELNLGCFTEIFRYAPMILPSLILAPAYFAGKITLGDVTMGSMAFMNVLNALNAIIGKISGLSALAASFTRVETFVAALEQPSISQNQAGATIIKSREDSRLLLDHVSLNTPDNRKTLTRDVTVELSPGKGLLISGESGVGKSSLLRAIAGLWNAGEGEIVRPPFGEMFFLPQRPYMIHGTLREQLLYPNCDSATSDDTLKAVLAKVNLSGLDERFDGFDVIKDWAQLLSLGEQQRLSFARLLLTSPKYAILDEATSALDLQNEAELYRQFKDSGMTYVSVGHRSSLLAYHDNVLELQGKANWRFVPAAGFQIAVEA
jgi:putative ATP-binding cassette transporter